MCAGLGNKNVLGGHLGKINWRGEVRGRRAFGMGDHQLDCGCLSNVNKPLKGLLTIVRQL